MSQEVNKTREDRIQELKKELTGKQLKFCEEYLIDLNATQAAKRSGYSEKTAYVIGYENLRKPQLKEYISLRLDDYDLTASELIKMMTSIAKSSMNDYMVHRVIKLTRRVKKPLQMRIDLLGIDVIKKHKYLGRAVLTDEERHGIEEEIERINNTIVKLEIDLELDPEATYEVSEEYEEEVAELDLLAMAKDKENGRIKSFANTATGIKVEMNDADGMIKTLAQIKGLITNKVDATIESNNTNINANVTPEEAKAIADAILKDI